MKIVIASDSFKGSLSSIEVGEAISDGIKRVYNNIDIEIVPMADGGEGTVDALIEGLKGEKITTRVLSPLGDKISSYYGIVNVNGDRVAVMEMASCSGLTLVDRNNLKPELASTYGFGMQILDAINRGVREFIIGIGGSATSDGGSGMLSALGFEFLDRDGKAVPLGLGGLDKIEKIVDNSSPILKECNFNIACDVDNPLLGERGAIFIYGPQKGIKLHDREELDKKMKHFADISESFTGKNIRDVEGAGAAGGLGFGFLNFLNGNLSPGIKLISELLNLEEKVKDASILITGEGRLDHQTVMGKLPVGVASIGKKYGCLVLAFAGGVTRDSREVNNRGIDAYFPVIRESCNFESLIDPINAKKNIMDTVEQVFRLLAIKNIK